MEEQSSTRDKSEIVDSDECPHIAIDVGGDTAPVCRICHLSSKEIDQSVDQLIEIGCGCRGELGVAHVQCAEAWFKVKGNQCCEICGETAKNIMGTPNEGFMEVWNDGHRDARENTEAASGDAGRRRWVQGKHLCNLLLVFLVILFIFPWFLRGNWF